MYRPTDRPKASHKNSSHVETDHDLDHLDPKLPISHVVPTDRPTDPMIALKMVHTPGQMIYR